MKMNSDELCELLLSDFTSCTFSVFPGVCYRRTNKY